MSIQVSAIVRDCILFQNCARLHIKGQFHDHGLTFRAYIWTSKFLGTKMNIPGVQKIPVTNF